MTDLILVCGDRGSGKTLLLTRFALKNNSPFYANFDVFKNHIPNIQMLSEKEKSELEKHPLWHKLHPEELLTMDSTPKKVLITEAYEFFEARLGMGSFERYMSYIVFQSRKRNIDFIIDTQIDNSIDARYTKLCDFIIVAEASNDGFNYYISNKKIINSFHISFKQAEKIWDRYDSWEVVMTPQLEELGKKIEVTNKPKLKEKITELETRFYDEYGKDILKKKITHALVDSFLLDCEPPESDVYASYLYARLQKPTK